jgi:hypothetical protein
VLNCNRSLEHAAFELWEPELRDVCVRFCALPREIRDLISRRILPEALVNRTYSSDGTPSLWESVSSTLKKNFRRISTSAAFAQILNEVAQMFLHKTHFRYDNYRRPKLGLLLDAPLSGTHVAPHRKMRDIVLEVHCSAKDTGFPERYLSQILMRPALDILALHTFKKCDLRVSLKRLYGATVLCKLYVRELLPSLWRLHHQGMVVKMSFGSSTVNVSKSCVVEESDGSRWDLFSGSLFKWAEVCKSEETGVRRRLTICVGCGAELAEVCVACGVGCAEMRCWRAEKFGRMLRSEAKSACVIHIDNNAIITSRSSLLSAPLASRDASISTAIVRSRF